MSQFFFLALADACPGLEVELYVEDSSMVRSSSTGTNRYGAYMETSSQRSCGVWGPGWGFKGNWCRRM